jgi:hypothetical protein
MIWAYLYIAFLAYIGVKSVRASVRKHGLGVATALEVNVTRFSMHFTVLFEHWHLGDGNYPAFSRGDTARLPFELYASGSTSSVGTAGANVRTARH